MGRRLARACRSRGSAGLLPVFAAERAAAHADAPPAPHDLWSSWNLDAWLWMAFALAIGLYARGLRQIWRRAGPYRGARPLHLASYVTGIVLLLLALISPLDALGEALSAAHMAQHMLIFFAAPFLVLAAPLPVYLWAFPLNWRRRLAGGVKQSWLKTGWNSLTAPPMTWALQAVALWGWHAPTLYQAALDRPLVHDLEHFTFLATGLLFWWAVFRSADRSTGLILIFTTMLHSGLLGALMTFSSRPWYPGYLESTAAWGLTPLQDQQIAGLLMWIPGGIGYLLAGLGVLALWLHRLENTQANSGG